MDLLIDDKLGKISIYKDFIKRNINKNGEVFYQQSNTSLIGYNPRTIGLCKYNDLIMAATVINNKSQQDTRTCKFILKNRLLTILNNDFNIMPNDTGFTYVPIEYVDLLWKDPYTYNILYGMLDPTYARMIIQSLK